MKTIILIALVLFSMNVSHALVVQNLDLGALEYDKDYEFSQFITNEGDTDLDMRMSLSLRSKYLDDYVLVDPKEFHIGAKSTRYIDFVLRTSRKLSPGKHEIIILPDILGDRREGFTINSVPAIITTFTLPGKAVKKISVKEIQITGNDTSKKIKLVVENSGNTRIAFFPYVEIFDGETLLEILDKRTQFLLEPGIQEISFDYVPPFAGTFKAVAFVKYDDTVSEKIITIFSSARTDRVEKLFISSVNPDNISALEDSEGQENAITLQINSLELYSTGNKIIAEAEVQNLGGPTRFKSTMRLFSDREIDAKNSDEFIDEHDTKKIINEFTVAESGKYKVVFEAGGFQKEKSIQITINSAKNSVSAIPITGFVTSENKDTFFLGIIVLLAVIFLIANKRVNRSNARQQNAWALQVRHYTEKRK